MSSCKNINLQDDINNIPLADDDPHGNNNICD